MEHITILPTHMSSVFDTCGYDKAGAAAGVAVGHLLHRIQDSRRSMLIIGDDDGTHWADIAQNTGARYLGQVTHAAAATRLSLTAHVDTVVLDCRDAIADLAPIGAALADLAQQGTTSIVISTSLDRLDRDLTALDMLAWPDASVYWLCGATADEQIEALTTALDQARISTTLHDSGKSSQNAQLEQLSLEVQRLSRTLEECAFPIGCRITSVPVHRRSQGTPIWPVAGRGGAKAGAGRPNAAPCLPVAKAR